MPHSKDMLLLESPEYYQFLTAIEATNPIVAWWRREGDSGGTTLKAQIGGVTFNGSYAGITWGNVSKRGIPMPSFDGVMDYATFYSSALAALSDGTASGILSEGCMMMSMSIANPSIWTDGTADSFFEMQRGGSSRISILKDTVNNQIRFRRLDGGSPGFQIVTSVITPPSANQNFTVGCSWSVSSGATGEFKALLNGAQVGVTQASLSVPAGSGLNSIGCTFMATDTFASAPTNGALEWGAIWGEPVNSDILALGVPL